MSIDFIAHLENSKVLKIYDISPLHQDLPTDIYSMTINIISSRIPNGKIDSPLDVISYLKTVREQNELMTITSNMLGIGYDKDIPDGVYHIEYVINNSIRINRVFLIYQTVKKETETLLQLCNYNVEIGTYDLIYLKDDVINKYDIEKVRYAKTLLDRLEYLAEVPNEVEANNTLVKLERLLGILKTI